MTISEKSTGRGDGIRANVLAGLAVSIFLVGGVGAWAATNSLAGAVIASGTVVVETSAKKVQHQTGGIVGQILVKEGDRVAAGDPVVRLDDTMTGANLQIIAQQHDRALARQARLRAERLGLGEIEFPESFAARASDNGLQAIVAGEKSLFESRGKASAGLKSQLDARASQLRLQIEGLAAQRQATEEAVAVLARDLDSAQKLYEQKLVSLDRVSGLQLDLARVKGEAGRLTAAIAETEGRIAETNLQSLQVDEDMRKDINEELRKLDGDEGELAERELVAKDQLARDEIRAPQSGVVQELAVHTVGGVVGAGETLMLIVPEQDQLVVDAMVSPASIDDVRPGQKVTVRFTAFDNATTPECTGTVQRVSADLIRDPQRQAAYFVARTVLDDRAACLSGERHLQAGMPAEVHIQTGERNVLSYVMKPLTDQISRAFRE